MLTYCSHDKGVYPVAGNGPLLLELLSRSHGRLNETQVSLETAPNPERSAPSPAIALFRDEGHERPSTAPYGSSQSARSFSGTSSRIRKPTPKARPPVSLHNTRHDNLASPQVPRNVAGSPTDPPAAEPARVVSPSSSVASARNSADRGYKDLLDAQSEIKPADFKSRVKAAGARDYGEDVADRNMGENGVDLASPQVQAFYASSTTSKPTQHAPHLPGLSRPRPRDEAFIRPVSKQASFETSLRTKSLNSANHHPFPQAGPSHMSRPSPLGLLDNAPFLDVRVPTTKSSRRQSLHTYVPTGSNGADARGTNGRLVSSHRNVHSTDVPHYTASSKDDTISWHAPSPDLSGVHSRTPPSVPKPWVGLAMAPRPASSSGFRPRTPREARDSVVLPHGRVETRPATVVSADAQADRYTPSEMSFSHHKPLTYSHRGSVTSFASQRQSRHTLHSSISSSIASHDTAQNFTPLAYPM